MIAPSPEPRREPLVLRALREGDWLTSERARLFCRTWLAVSVVVVAAWVLLARNGLDVLGKPIGTDFTSFWTASQLALSGHPAQVYDVAIHHQAQTRLFGRDTGYAAFFYPPIFLWICLPLASLPYLASLAAWLAATGAAYARVTRAFLGEAAGWVAILAFPAVLINAGHGQNGFLSAALFGGGVLLMNRRPMLAGALLGCLAYKPQLGLLIPIALLAAGRWRVIAGAAGAVLALAGLSVWAFGLATWRAFLAVSPLARAALEQDLVGYGKMQSVFAAIRLLHGGLALAYGAQALAALAACAALVFLQRKAPRAEAEGPALVAASLLASPFLLDYDLILLAIPLAWLTAQGLRTGFRSYEKTILAAGFILPAISRPLAMGAGVPLGPLVIAAVFWLVLRRWAQPGQVEAPTHP
ncbi:MAG: glycosyltransferase family 87 protein [Caulobacteraceae bacterium]|nr:glycosyltransferase family 87 protein [Caulobacteraceae bacterium]